MFTRSGGWAADLPRGACCGLFGRPGPTPARAPPVGRWGSCQWAPSAAQDLLFARLGEAN